ncbi:MAG: hypothetical protein NZ473_02245 [Candidatus Kapabacteria bacterium]|nr:hypothetical protein [Candidatus Kapabacteria bacterium]MCS7170216.1 hypothetical protein [Candidatus Kapabacteria bacterium]MDW7997696.1 hypothetical protein [Bacteroidota bacterium]MDW8225981.1 hypothetical protein [Bacteroidota bacterium]
MFEREIRTEKQRLLRLLGTSEPFILLTNVLQLPETELPYKRYLWAEIQWQLHEEHLLRQRHPYFDYTDPELTPLLQRIDELLLRHARFPRQELELLVDSAVKVRLNFLCRPRTTLKWFIFRGEPLKQRTEILRRLDYLSDYPYLTSGVRHHIQQLELSTGGDGVLSILEFERIVQQADDSALELTPSQFLELLQPLEAFFYTTNPGIHPKHLPTAALIIFLDDKGIRLLAQELEQLLRHQRLLWISHKQFLELVTRLLIELEMPPADTHTIPLQFPDDAPAEAAQGTTSTTSTEIPSADIYAPPPSVPERQDEPAQNRPPSLLEQAEAATPSVEEVPSEGGLDEIALSTEVLQNIQSVVTAEPEPKAVSTAASEPASGSDCSEHLMECLSPPPLQHDNVLWSDGAISSDTLQATWEQILLTEDDVPRAFPTPLPDPEHADTSQKAVSPEPPGSAPESEAPTTLVRLLSDPDWYRRYARSLFPTEDAYAEVTRRLCACSHWKLAAAVIDRLFVKYGIDPQSHAARQFRQEILRHYNIQTGTHALH